MDGALAAGLIAAAATAIVILGLRSLRLQHLVQIGEVHLRSTLVMAGLVGLLSALGYQLLTPRQATVQDIGMESVPEIIMPEIIMPEINVPSSPKTP